MATRSSLFVIVFLLPCLFLQIQADNPYQRCRTKILTLLSPAMDNGTLNQFLTTIGQGALNNQTFADLAGPCTTIGMNWLTPRMMSYLSQGLCLNSAIGLSNAISWAQGMVGQLAVPLAPVLAKMSVAANKMAAKEALGKGYGLNPIAKAVRVMATEFTKAKSQEGVTYVCTHSSASDMATALKCLKGIILFNLYTTTC